MYYSSSTDFINTVSSSSGPISQPSSAITHLELSVDENYAVNGSMVYQIGFGVTSGVPPPYSYRHITFSLSPITTAANYNTYGGARWLASIPDHGSSASNPYPNPPTNFSEQTIPIRFYPNGDFNSIGSTVGYIKIDNSGFNPSPTNGSYAFINGQIQLTQQTSTTTTLPTTTTTTTRPATTTTTTTLRGVTTTTTTRPPTTTTTTTTTTTEPTTTTTTTTLAGTPPPAPTTTTTTTTPIATTTTTTTVALPPAPTTTTTTTTLPDRPLPIKTVETIQVFKNEEKVGTDSSDSKGTLNTINSKSLSFGSLAPGETSGTMTIYLKVPASSAINNIRLALTESGGLTFGEAKFGVETHAFLDYNIVPSEEFLGVNANEDPDSGFNINIGNNSLYSSEYVYLNVTIPRDQLFATGTIRYKWYFDYA